MSQLAYLKQQIKAIQTTKKVTHALRLVSMSLYSKLEKQEKMLAYYTANIQDLFLELTKAVPHWRNGVLFPDDLFDSKPLFIIVATSKGLCGSLNSNFFRYLEQSVFLKENQAAHFITVGQKAYKVVKEKGWGEIIYSYNEFNSNSFITIADALIEKIIHGGTQYSSVSFFCNERRSFFLQRPYKSTLIPLSLDHHANKPHDEFEHNEHKEEIHILDQDDIIWEQSIENILDVLSISYVRSSIIRMLFQQLLAEYSARFLAMDSSTTNAEKLLEKLTLQYNKARQAAITKEVSELSAGFLSN